MTPLAFLAIPAITVTIGCMWLWARSRNPQSLSSGIDDFRREMAALAPEDNRPGTMHDPGRGSD